MGRRILGVAFCLGLVCMALWIGVSCYAAPEPNCGFQCGPNGECPTDYACSSTQVCEKIGATDVCKADAGVPDSLDANLAAPMVVSTTPLNGDTQVQRGLPISVTFDQDVVGVDLTSFTVAEGPTQLVGTVTYLPQSFSANFLPDQPLPAGSVITVNLTSAITNTLHVPLSPYTWQFTTIDDVAPTVAASAPMDMATNIPTSTTIVVEFSEPVENVNTSTFTVAQGVTPIAGAIVGTGDAITYTFTPTAALPSGLPITVTLSAAITDTSNNPLVPVMFTFTTM